MHRYGNTNENFVGLFFRTGSLAVMVADHVARMCTLHVAFGPSMDLKLSFSDVRFLVSEALVHA